jgi:hypothetical protein
VVFDPHAKSGKLHIVVTLARTQLQRARPHAGRDGSGSVSLNMAPQPAGYMLLRNAAFSGERRATTPGVRSHFQFLDVDISPLPCPGPLPRFHRVFITWLICRPDDHWVQNQCNSHYHYLSPSCPYGGPMQYIDSIHRTCMDELYKTNITINAAQYFGRHRRVTASA